MKVFYHNDNDGKCCAALVYQHYNVEPPDHCSEIPIGSYKMDYGMKFPIENISKDEKVYILDYSIEVNEMKELLKITQKVVWIDHHKSAIEKYLGFLSELDKESRIIEGNRNINYAGCELVWFHYHKNDPIPEFVKYVADRDMWRWKFGDDTKNYNDGLILQSTVPSSKIWSDKFVQDIIKEGGIVSRTKSVLSIEQLEERGFWITFHGYDCYCINSDVIRGSEYLEMCEPKADIWMVFRLCHGHLVNDENTVTNPDDIYWTVSLYSKNPDIDVSKISMNYIYNGKIGGGHKYASGFQSKGLDFLWNKK